MAFDVPEASCSVCKRKRRSYTTEVIRLLDPFQLTPNTHKRAHFYYGIRIVAGSERVSVPHKKDIYVALVGNKACTGKLKIAHKWFGSIGTSLQYYDDVMVESNKPLGEVLVVNLGTFKRRKFAALLVNYVEVYDIQTKIRKEFPCYCRIQDGDDVSFGAKTGK